MYGSPETRGYSKLVRAIEYRSNQGRNPAAVLTLSKCDS
jgi:hypothetical protein